MADEATVDLGAWGTEVGLLDDFDLVVTRAVYAPDARYHNGQVMLLQLSGRASCADGSVVDDHTEMLSCGQEWESRDGGRSVQHPKGKAKFNKSSNLGMWIERLIHLDPAHGATLLQHAPDPRVADAWLGLSVHANIETVQFGKEIGDKDRTLPTAFHGFVDVTATAAPAAPPVAAAPATAAPAPAPEIVQTPLASTPAPTNGGPDPRIMEAKLKVLAKTAPTHSAFIDAVLDAHPEIATDDGLMARVVDESAIYAEARA